MILTKEISVILKSQTIKYFESLGYQIPKYYNPRRKKWFVKRNTKINIQIKHLNKGSHYQIKCQCDICKTIRTIPFKDYRSLCNICSKNTPEARQQNSQRQIGKFTGSNNPNWKSYLTQEDRQYKRTQTSSWKRQVKEKYDYTCQKCNHKGKPKDNFMIAHHLNNYAQFKEQRTDVNNGSCLCCDCHKEIHHQFGLFTTNDHFQKFIQSRS